MGEHPHRGFETVTIVYQGEVEHRDSAGSGGTIGPGDVQWMTAASGVVHEEFHGADFTRSGGTLEMVQLWVNLPAKDKMTRAALPGHPATAHSRGAAARRRGHGARDRRRVRRDARAGADLHADQRVGRAAQGRARRPSSRCRTGTRVALVVLRGDGAGQRRRDRARRAAGAVRPRRRASTLSLRSRTATPRSLLLGGEPIDEPVVGYGPFVMNTQAEIRQAIDDFNDGRFGRMPA